MTEQRLEDLRQMAAVHPKSEWMDECIEEIDRLRISEASLSTSEAYWKACYQQEHAQLMDACLGLAELSQCGLNIANCASLEIASARIRNIATVALNKARLGIQ